MSCRCARCAREARAKREAERVTLEVAALELYVVASTPIAEFGADPISAVIAWSSRFDAARRAVYEALGSPKVLIPGAMPAGEPAGSLVDQATRHLAITSQQLAEARRAVCGSFGLPKVLTPSAMPPSAPTGEPVAAPSRSGADCPRVGSTASSITTMCASCGRQHVGPALPDHWRFVPDTDSWACSIRCLDTLLRSRAELTLPAGYRPTSNVPLGTATCAACGTDFTGPYGQLPPGWKNLGAAWVCSESCVRAIQASCQGGT